MTFGQYYSVIVAKQTSTVAGEKNTHPQASLKPNHFGTGKAT